MENLPSNQTPSTGLFMMGVDPDEYRSQIAEQVLETLKPTLVKNNEPRLVGGDRMAELLSISRSTLDRYVKQGLIPSVSIGNSRRFEPRTVIDALSEAADR